MKPMQIAAKKKTKIPKRITKDYLHNSGLYYLERFSSSKQHFILVMMRKVKRSCAHHVDQNYEDCAALVQALAQKFEQSGLLNDDLYARGMVTSLRRRGLSSSSILNKMRQKGIASELTSEKLQNVDADTHTNPHEAEIQAALRLAQKKKIGPYHPSPADEDKRKSLSCFARAGFSYDIASRILKMELADFENYTF